MSSHPGPDFGELAQFSTLQPSLFAGDAAAIDLDLCNAARRVASAPAHTGKIVEKNEQRCAVIYAMLSAGVSRREIARRMGVGRHSIDRIEQIFESGGKLAPLKERVLRDVALLVHDAAAEAREVVLAGVGDMDSASWLKSLSLTMKLSFDANQLGTGQATEIIEQRSAPNHEEFAAWMRSAVEVQTVPSQSESVGFLAASVDLQALGPIGAGAGAELVPDSAAKVAFDLAQGAGGEQGEGGVAPSAGVVDDDGSRPSKIISQGRRPKQPKRTPKA